MSRIRALTVLALSAHACQSMLDEYTADDSAPSWLAFEWMWAEATATGGSDTRGIPGIDTTRRRLHNGERLSSRNYLKGAMALGLHGFYRTLAEDTLVLDRNGFLDENGERLLGAWAADQGFKGCSMTRARAAGSFVSCATPFVRAWTSARARRRQPERPSGAFDGTRHRSSTVRASVSGLSFARF